MGTLPIISETSASLNNFPTVSMGVEKYTEKANSSINSLHSSNL